MRGDSWVGVLRLVLIGGAILALLPTLSCRQKAGTETGTRGEGIVEATKIPGTLIGMQYEPFFTPHNVGSWDLAEAIPILGKYNSYDLNVIKKHEEWFEQLGIDWLLLDWSNMLWMKPAWEEHKEATRELEETTELLFRTYHELAQAGKRPPKLVIMLGFQNGPAVPNSTQRLNGVIRWITAKFLAKSEYRNGLLDYQGKPLLTILYTAPLTCEELNKQTAGVLAHDWTVRWMGSQLQDSHVEKCGYWSWMDGTIRQVVTFQDHVPEETVVTPACFPFPFTEVLLHKKGWLDPGAAGRDHGVPYLESWKVAFENRPKFIQVHQWNEFIGTKEGEGGGPQHDLYGDEYNLEFSDDIEPTQMDKCAYRGCGGWGYYYMNLTKALISLYRGQTPDITVMALSGPFQPAEVKQKFLTLKWAVVGKKPISYSVQMDGKLLVENLQREEYVLDLSKAARGKHRVTVTAKGVYTYFDLGPEQMAERSEKQLPVTSTLGFTYLPVAR